MNNVRLDAGHIQIYTGDGKGKTTAALGLALRAAGHGLRTYIGQFLKGQGSGELEAVRELPAITIEQYGGAALVRPEDIGPDDMDRAQEGLAKARQAMLSGEYSIVVLDEVNVALSLGLLELDDVLALLDRKPQVVELVLTGCGAPEGLVERADLVTEMRRVKHYFERGVKARSGIED